MIAVILASVALAKDPPLPPDLPPFGADRPIPTLPLTRKTLGNGVEVWVVPRTDVPKVAVVVAVKGGLGSDPAGHPGASDLLADLLDEGTPTRSAQQIAEQLQTVGGSFSASASYDGLLLRGDAFASKGEALIQLLADLARNAAYPDAEVTLARDNAIAGLASQESDPRFLSARAFEGSLFAGHPYGSTDATAKSLQAVSPQFLRELHAARFRPDRTLVVVVGKVDAGKATGWVKKAFGDWKATGPAPADPPPLPTASAPKRVVVDRPGSVQSTVRVGRVGPPAASEDAIPLAVTNTLMGGGYVSRITQNIRQDKGYTYSPRGVASRYLLGGLVYEAADVRNEVTAATVNEIFYEFDRMGTTPIDPDELARAKRYVAGTYLFQNQMQGSVAGTLASNWLVGLPPEFVTTYVEKATAVTADQVRAIAQKYYASRTQSVVIVGDRAAIATELAQYGDFVPFVVSD